MTSRDLLAGLLGVTLGAMPVHAQRGAAPLRGVVFDSLRGRPLRNAFVTMPGQSQPASTDTLGHFRFDSVSPGSYVITAQHPLLDSIGLSGLAARTVVGDGREVQLAIPSFATLWRASCQGPVPRDSGMVFGTIRDAVTGAPIVDADIELAWSDLVQQRWQVVDRTWRVNTRSNARGGYAVCGVPADLPLHVRAQSDSGASGMVTMAPASVRVRRRDLLLGARARATGVVVGTVYDADGNPVAGARVLFDSAEVRADAEGHFRMNGVPAGTREIEAVAIGAVPVTTTVDVHPRDSAVIALHLQKYVALEAMKTFAARSNRVMAAEFDARRKSGFGYTRDSTQLSRYDSFVNAFRDVPSLNIQYRTSNLSMTLPDGVGGYCTPDVLIDGASAAFGHLIDLQPSEVGGLEVYTRAAHIPPRFVPPGVRPQCGMILVWTKYGFRNR